MFYNTKMKYVPLLALITSAAMLAGCESTQKTAGSDTLESRRLAAVQRQHQEAAQMSVDERNLWDAHTDLLKRDGNPNRTYDAP
jgi:outer membrane murein-binding lipoprotein Lpp